MERGRAQGRWVQGEIRDSLSCLRPRTLVVLGMGSIGRAAARIARTFDMRVIGVSRTARTDTCADRTIAVEQLSNVLPEADALLISILLTPATRWLVGAGELARLKPSTVLINVTRGEVVDEAALVRALADGRAIMSPTLNRLHAKRHLSSRKLDPGAELIGKLFTYATLVAQIQRLLRRAA
jgi:phosphoglycerate dehydrogenase-like enzyme